MALSPSFHFMDAHFVSPPPFCSFSFFKYLNVIHQFWVLILNVCAGEWGRWKPGRRRTMTKLLVLLGLGDIFITKLISDNDMNET